MHQVCADEPGEGERTLHNSIGILSQAQQHKGDERHGDLNANGVLGGSEEVADFQGLLDPSKEQLDTP